MCVGAPTLQTNDRRVVHAISRHSVDFDVKLEVVPAHNRSSYMWTISLFSRGLNERKTSYFFNYWLE